MQTIYTKKLISPVCDTASGGSKIWTLAGEDANGNKAILISNPTANTINLSLTLNSASLSTSLFPYIDQYSVTDQTNGESATAWTGGAFVLTPYTSHLITMSTTASGITESHLNKQNITLYPNPSNNSINFSELLQNISVYNAFGQLVISQIKLAKSISVQGLSKGIYFIHADNGIFKFIVEH